MAPFVDTPAGEEVGQRLWEETLADLDFANVRDILEDCKAAKA